jgi:hypothetical protein
VLDWIAFIHYKDRDPAFSCEISNQAWRKCVGVTYVYHQGFVACCVLALFPRIGFTGEPAGELRFLAEALEVPEPELRAAARSLTELGLLTTKGRYRSVTPQPLAVFLASRAWDDFEDRIVGHLLPKLDGGGMERILHRAAEIGPSASILQAVRGLLARSDLFGSLRSLDESGYSEVLPQLAILAPEDVTSRLASVIDAATNEELLQLSGFVTT